MINITKNTENTFVLELNGLSNITCNCLFIFKFVHIHSNSTLYFTTDDVSTSCRYNEFILTDDDDSTDTMKYNDFILVEDDDVNMLSGQYDYFIINVATNTDVEDYIEADYVTPVEADYISSGILIVDGIDENVNISLQ